MKSLLDTLEEIATLPDCLSDMACVLAAKALKDWEESSNTLKPRDIAVETWSSSGSNSWGTYFPEDKKGIKITHIPSGIVTCCESERSQHKNKAICIKLLKLKLGMEW